MCAINYHIWLRGFKTKSKNVRWPRFFGPRCIFAIVVKRLTTLTARAPVHDVITSCSSSSSSTVRLTAVQVRVYMDVVQQHLSRHEANVAY